MSTKNKHSDIYLSVIIPAYNEAQRIGPTLRAVAEHLAAKDYASEIIVVDDGSKDNTHEVVLAEMRNIPNLFFLDGQPNKGKGFAVNRGMRAARGEYRVFMDADGSVSIREIDRFLFHAAYGYDVVIASISHPSQIRPVVERAGALRRAFGSMSHALVRFFATPGIYDTQRGFKLFSAAAADTIFTRQTINRFGFDIELLVIATHHGLRVKEVAVAWNNAPGSTVRAVDYFRTFKELYRIVTNRSAHAYD